MDGSTALANFALVVAYDGRPFFGWQRHGDQPTIQAALEQAIEAVSGQASVVVGSGRTDRGAHAIAQVAGVRLVPGLDPGATIEQLNEVLPAEIRVLSLVPVADEFHARDDATAKIYRYVIWNHKQLPKAKDGYVWHLPKRLDVEAMRLALPILVGEHDFASFATKPNFKQKSTRRTLVEATLEQAGPELTFEFRADGFLYKMVRNLVRALVKIGQGRSSASELERILAACDRQAAPGTAPASGLYLREVFYADYQLGAPASVDSSSSANTQRGLVTSGAGPSP